MKAPRFRLPQLPPMAKAQLWGMLVGLALALLTTQRLGLSYRLVLLGFAAAWIASEFVLARRLTGRTDAASLALGVLSGFAFPWAGVALAYMLQALRP